MVILQPDHTPGQLILFYHEYCLSLNKMAFCVRRENAPVMLIHDITFIVSPHKFTLQIIFFKKCSIFHFFYCHRRFDLLSLQIWGVLKRRRCWPDLSKKSCLVCLVCSTSALDKENSFWLILLLCVWLSVCVHITILHVRWRGRSNCLLRH